MTIQQHASFDSSAAELNATSKLVKAWESKNAKNAAKAGGISMMALSLAACGGSSTTTTTPVVETPVVDTPTVDAAKAMVLTTSTDAGASFTGGSGNDTFTATHLTLGTTDEIDGGAGAGDVLTITSTSDEAFTASIGLIENVETINVSNQGTSSVGSAEVATVAFQAIDAGQTLIINGLTVTAGASGASAADIASAIVAHSGSSANTVGGATVTGTAASTYTAAAGGDTTSVKFTSASVGDLTDLDVAGTAVTGTSQTTSITLATNANSSGATNTFTLNGTTVTFAAAASATPATQAASMAAAINAAYGSAIASASNAIVAVRSDAIVNIGAVSASAAGTTFAIAAAPQTVTVKIGAAAATASDNAITFDYNGVELTASVASDAAVAAQATAIAASINAHVGKTVATTIEGSVAGDTVSVTDPDGVVLANFATNNSGSTFGSITTVTAALGVTDVNAPTVSVVDGVAAVTGATFKTTFDASRTDDATEMASVNSFGDVEFTNMSATQSGTVSGNTSVTNGDTTFGYKATVESVSFAIKGGTTAGDITLTGAGITAATISSTGAANTVGTIDVAGAETVSIDADTALTATALTSASATSLTVTGDSLVTVTDDLDAGIVTVTASGSTGGINVDAGDVAEASTAKGPVDLTVTGSSAADTVDLSSVNVAREVSVDLGAGNDTLILDAAQANSADDSISGGAGEDTISYTAGTTLDAKFSDAVSGFETLKVDAVASVTMAALDEFSANNYLVNVDDGTAGNSRVVVSLDGLASGATITLNADADKVTRDSADADGVELNVSLTTDDTSTGAADAVTINFADSYEEISDDSQDDFEVVTLNNTNTTDSVVELVDFGAATSVTINSSTGKDLEITALTTAATATIDASGSSDDLTINVTGGDGKVFKMGAGDDTLKLNADDSFRTANTIEGGAGDDELIVNDVDTDVGAPTVSGFETVTLLDIDDGGTIDLRNFTGVDTVVVDTVGTNDSVTLNRVGSDTTIRIGSNMGSGVLTATTESGTAQSIEMTTVGSAFELDLTIDVVTETLNIKVGDGDGTTAEAGINIDSLTGASLESIYITGEDDADIGTVGNTVTLIDASASDGNIIATAGTADTVIIGGDAADTLTGGSGDDTITGGKGNDALNGAAGSDTYVFAATGELNGTDDFKDGGNSDAVSLIAGSSGDKLDFTAFGVTTVDQNGASGTAINEYSAGATSDVDISGKIVMLSVADNSAHTNISVDGTGDIAALIDGAGDVFSITAGGKAVVVSGDTAVDTSTADDENLYIFFVHDANGDGDVADTNEVTLVGQTVLDFDLDTLTTDNFVIA